MGSTAQCESYQSHESSPYTNQRTGCDDDQGELPSLHEAHEEATHEGGEALDEDAHLVRDRIVYLIDVTVMHQGPKQTSLCLIVIMSLKPSSG